jgi:predicted transcriptional regulator
VPKAQWARRTVRDLTQACDAEDTIVGGVDAMQALVQMTRARRGRLMVIDGDRLLGIITLKDLLEFLALQMGWQPSVRWG